MTIAFDTDRQAAFAQRRKAFTDAARQGHLVGASHLSFPGAGMLLRDGAGDRFQPTKATTSLKK